MNVGQAFYAVYKFRVDGYDKGILVGPQETDLFPPSLGYDGDPYRLDRTYMASTPTQVENLTKWAEGADMVTGIQIDS